MNSQSTSRAPDPDRLPVIIAIGECADRSEDLAQAMDPAGLMVEALRLAERDCGMGILSRLDRLEIINEVSWPYPDPGEELQLRLGLPELTAHYWPIGGQTPITALHEAALKIQAGEAEVIAVCGAEAQASVRNAKRAGTILNWPPLDQDNNALRGTDFQSDAARALGLVAPVNVYPLYENATRVFWEQSFASAQNETAQIWANNASLARRREASWIKTPVTPDDILSEENGNRLIAWPYRKLMVANPMVNQGAAFILTSRKFALAAGMDENRLVYILDGAAADEPRDILARKSYHTSPAMEGVLSHVSASADTAFDVELYSCFPCVPKMARRSLGLAADVPLSLAGGLTFFGAPLNNYMSHAVVAAVESIRKTGREALLYGQGEYVTKHHAIMLGATAPHLPLADNYRLAELEQDLVRHAPLLDQSYQGPARLETFTILFDREQQPVHGVVILQAPNGARSAARIATSDRATLEFLQSSEEAIGVMGETISVHNDMVPHWSPNL